MSFLVGFETNKYIHNSYHHLKYVEKYNLDKFISIITNNTYFKEHKDFNQINTFFNPSIEILVKEILNDLLENGLDRKKPRLEQFLNDLKKSIDIYKNVLETFDFNNVEYFYSSIRKYIMSNNNDLNMAIADTRNLLNEYQIIEKSIIQLLINKISDEVSSNYQFIIFDFWYDDEPNTNGFNHKNIAEEKIKKYFNLLLLILYSKNISKKEIVDLFKKLCSYSSYYKGRNRTHFDSQYPIDLENIFNSTSEYYFQIMNKVNNLSITDRFNKFVSLLYEEKDYYYIFQILNAELNNTDEVQYGDITYYNEKVFKSKGLKDNSKYDMKDTFRNEKELKAIIKFKTKKHFPNSSALRVKKIIENNISFFKLFHNNNSNEKEIYFKPSPSKMDVSYSHFVLDEDFFFLQGSHTIYDGDNSLQKNIIYDKVYKKDEYQNKLNSFISHLNYKQIDNNLTNNDYLILQSFQKFKQSVETNTYSELLLYTWNGLEYLTKAFPERNKKLEIIEDLTKLIYSFIYTNSYYKWDLDNPDALKEIEYRSKKLVIYAYTYRNKLVHSHLIEDSYMISVSKGINIIFRNLLSLIIDKIIIDSDFDMEQIIYQLKSDLNKRVKEVKGGK